MNCRLGNIGLLVGTLFFASLLLPSKAFGMECKLQVQECADSKVRKTVYLFFDERDVSSSSLTKKQLGQIEAGLVARLRDSKKPVDSIKVEIVTLPLSRIGLKAFVIHYTSATVNEAAIVKGINRWAPEKCRELQVPSFRASLGFPRGFVYVLSGTDKFEGGSTEARRRISHALSGLAGKSKILQSMAPPNIVYIEVSTLEQADGLSKLNSELEREWGVKLPLELLPPRYEED